MRFVRFIPRGRFHDVKPRALPLDLPTIGFGFLAVVVVMVIVSLAIPTIFHSWHRYPSPVRSLRPAYPARELEMGIGGEVVVLFAINEQGEVTRLEVLDDGGSEALAESVLKAVETTRYRAQRVMAHRDRPGLPIGVVVTQRFVFDAEEMAGSEKPYGMPLVTDQVVYGDYDTLPVPETTVLPADMELYDPAAVHPPPTRPWNFRQYLVSLTVTPGGEATYPRVYFAFLGYRRNRMAVEAAVRGIRYTPATRNGEPVPCNITQLFTLPESYQFTAYPADRRRGDIQP